METLKNLMLSYVGECQARMRYDFFAKIANKEKHLKAAKIFTLTANQEKTHAKRFYEHIQKLKENENLPEINLGEIEVTYSNTIENLKSAINGEHHEYEDLYPKFADVADKEGFPEIAKRFRAISIAEKHHHNRYKELLEEIETGNELKSEEITVWICTECGYIHKGKEPPEICPSCDHPKEYYEKQKYI
jgi:rubrerythrin